MKFGLHNASLGSIDFSGGIRQNSSNKLSIPTIMEARGNLTSRISDNQPAMICILKVIDGPAQGAQLWISRNQSLMIGRMSTADFSIPSDPHLSRNHLFVQGGDRTFCVRDAGSSNGTFVNNSPVQEAQLQNGDLIRAGKSVFQVTLKEEATKDASFQSQVESDDYKAPDRKLLKNSSGDETERYQY